MALKFHSGDSSLSVAEGKHGAANGPDPLKPVSRDLFLSGRLRTSLWSGEEGRRGGRRSSSSQPLACGPLDSVSGRPNRFCPRRLSACGRTAASGRPPASPLYRGAPTTGSGLRRVRPEAGSGVGTGAGSDHTARRAECEWRRCPPLSEPPFPGQPAKRDITPRTGGNGQGMTRHRSGTLRACRLTRVPGGGLGFGVVADAAQGYFAVYRYDVMW